MPRRRILAIDPGARRVGLAISDALGVTAQGLETFDRRVSSGAGSDAGATNEEGGEGP